MMIALTGGDIVLPDRILSTGSLLIDGGRIVALESRAAADPRGAIRISADGCYVVPGFVDVHVHGVQGVDTLDGGDAVRQIAARLPRYGVTAFCPTTVACAPHELNAVLAQVRHARVSPHAGSARVLPAHLESNFINPAFRGAQPAACLRLPWTAAHSTDPAHGEFSARDIGETIERGAVDVGIVTLAPELPGGVELVRALASRGLIVSIGHTGATLDEAMAAIDAGARHATHLFNRMTALSHRSPGAAAAILSRDEVTAELICDGHHVHPAMCRVAVRAKGTSGVMAITDATAGAGLPTGAMTRLGGHAIRVTDHAAVLEDGTLAGSTLTMDRAFAAIVSLMGLSIADAATLCATTPARQLGMTGMGVIAEGAVADVVVLDRGFRVQRTFIDGVEVYRTGATA